MRAQRSPAPQLLFVLLALFSGACATASGPGTPAPGVTPALSAGSFIQAVQASDLDGMARIFGTADGPIADTGSSLGCAFRRMGSWIRLSNRCLTRVDVELRMNAIALILRHDQHTVGREEPVPGRDRPTVRVWVALTRGGQPLPELPLTLVRARSGRWMVEQIDLERITRS